jgi:hypothetical protein
VLPRVGDLSRGLFMEYLNSSAAAARIGAAPALH